MMEDKDNTTYSPSREYMKAQVSEWVVDSAKSIRSQWNTYNDRHQDPDAPTGKPELPSLDKHEVLSFPPIVPPSPPKIIYGTKGDKPSTVPGTTIPKVEVPIMFKNDVELMRHVEHKIKLFQTTVYFGDHDDAQQVIVYVGTDATRAKDAVKRFRFPLESINRHAYMREYLNGNNILETELLF